MKQGKFLTVNDDDALARAMREMDATIMGQIQLNAVDWLKRLPPSEKKRLMKNLIRIASWRERMMFYQRRRRIRQCAIVCLDAVQIILIILHNKSVNNFASNLAHVAREECRIFCVNEDKCRRKVWALELRTTVRMSDVVDWNNPDMLP